MTQSCTISETKRDIGVVRKTRFSYMRSTPLVGSPLEYCDKAWYGKARMVWLPDREKKFENRGPMFTRFEAIHERIGRTDGRTPHDSIART